ncbi:hypothetical protein YB2330_001446 [Saitoella coloradoensis]
MPPHAESDDVLASSVSTLTGGRLPSPSTRFKSTTQLFLARKFPQALQKAQTLLDSTEGAWKLKAWGLWVAILNAGADMNEEAGVEMWGNAEWDRVKKLVREDGVWKEACQVFECEETELSVDVFAPLTLSSIRRGSHLQPLQTRLEHLIASAPPPTELTEQARTEHTKLLELYTLHLLPKLGEWEYAKEFVEGNTMLVDAEKEMWTSTLESLREGERERAEAAEREAREEAEEAAKASKTRKSSSSSPSSKGRKKTSSRKYATNDTNGSTTPTKDLPSCAEDTVSPLYAASAAALPSSSSLSHFTKFSSFLLFFTAKYRHILRLLFMVIAIVEVVRRERVRERVKREWGVVWGKVWETVGMASKVTY